MTSTTQIRVRRVLAYLLSFTLGLAFAMALLVTDSTTVQVVVCIAALPVVTVGDLLEKSLRYKSFRRSQLAVTTWKGDISKTVLLLAAVFLFLLLGNGWLLLSFAFGVAVLVQSIVTKSKLDALFRSPAA